MRISKEALAPRLTLMESAQMFHWTECSGGWAAVCGGDLLTVMPHGDEWEIRSDRGDDALVRYFDLERDYDALLGFADRSSHYQWALSAEDAPCDSVPEPISGFDVTTNASPVPNGPDASTIRSLRGLRVCNQTPWDALVAFLLSQNNNASRIRALSTRLCAAYGTRAERDGLTGFGYPSPETLALVSEDELRKMRFGYRAAYLVRCARMVADGFPLADARALPYDRARELLTRLPGVGGKVADCVLLFGCGHAEAFPVDIWVERLLRDWFGVTAANRDAAAAIARDRFGSQAGILQQYWFHCARMGLASVTRSPKEG